MTAETPQPPVGIDLGTTYSVTAYLDATGRPVTGAQRARGPDHSRRDLRRPGRYSGRQTGRQELRMLRTAMPSVSSATWASFLSATRFAAWMCRRKSSARWS